MKPAFKIEKTIGASPTAVWELLTDWDRIPEWMGSVSVMKPVEGDAVGAGVPLHVEARGQRMESWVDRWEPERLLSLASRQGGVTARYDYRLEPTSTGTRMTLEAFCQSDGVWSLLSPLIRRAMRWTDGGQLEALGRLVTEEAA